MHGPIIWLSNHAKPLYTPPNDALPLQIMYCFGFRYNDTAGKLITVMSFERHGISNHKQLDCFSGSLTCWTAEQITCVLISSHNYVFNSTQFNGIWNGWKCKTFGKYCCFPISMIWTWLGGPTTCWRGVELSTLGVTCQNRLATDGFMLSAIIKPACKMRFMGP